MTPPDLLKLAAGAAILGLATLSTGVSVGRTSRGNPLLTAFLACFAAANLFGLVLLGGQAWISPDAVRWLRVIEVPLVYLLGPLLYGHARALLTPAQAAATPLPLAHLLPAGLAFAISLLNALAPFEASPLGDVLFQLSFHGWLLQGAPYLLAALWLSLRVPPAPPGAAIQRSGLRGLAIVMAGCWLASAMNRWPPDAAPLLASIGLSLLTTMGMYLLACRVVRQQLRVRASTAAPIMVDMTASAEDTTHARYERSGIDAAQCAAIASALTALMQDERLHEAPGLDLQTLSQRSAGHPTRSRRRSTKGWARASRVREQLPRRCREGVPVRSVRPPQRAGHRPCRRLRQQVDLQQRVQARHRTDAERVPPPHRVQLNVQSFTPGRISRSGRCHHLLTQRRR
jgi:hypothetical protein